MASTQLSIPTRYRSGAESIALFSAEETEAIRVSMEKGELLLNAHSSAEILGSLKNIDASSLKQIVLTLKSLYSARGTNRNSVETFAKDLVKDIRRRKPNLFPSAEGWAGATRNFESLLRIDHLEIANRERLVRVADDRRFCGAEVLVELRPIFTGDAGDELRRLLVAYRLKLGFHTQGDKHEDLYISLDLDDIQALRESLNQAELQGDILEKQAKKMLRTGGR